MHRNQSETENANQPTNQPTNRLCQAGFWIFVTQNTHRERERGNVRARARSLGRETQPMSLNRYATKTVSRQFQRDSLIKVDKINFCKRKITISNRVDSWKKNFNKQTQTATAT